MDFGKIGEELFGDISERFDSFCSEVDEAINCKLLAVGAHIKEFWSEIVQDIINKSPEKAVDVEEVEVTKISDSRMPTAIVDKEKNNSDMCSIAEVNIMVPDDHLQRILSFEENAATGMYNNSSASYNENCIDEATITSLGSCESVSRSFIEWENCWHVDTDTDLASDQQADDPVAFSKLSEAELSDQGVESDDLPSILPSGRSDVSGTEDVLDLEDYLKVDEISHRERSTEGADGPLVTEEFIYATLSQFAKPEFCGDYLLVNTSEISSIPSLEKNNGISDLKSVDIKKNKPSEDQERVKNSVPTLPQADLVRRDEEISEDDWVVI